MKSRKGSMFKIIKILNFKLLLRVALCIQLCLSPYYGYSANNADSSPPKNASSAQESAEPGAAEVEELVRQQEEQLREKYKDRPQVLEQIGVIERLTTAIDSGNLGAYLEANPEIKREAQDIFLLANQTVEPIKYIFDPRVNRFVPQVGETLKFNDSDSHPIPVIFNKVKVRYNRQSRELVFEGILEKDVGGTLEEQVVVRHRVPDMEVRDYANDGEMLVIVDDRKGLLLVDMVFVEAHLSRAPIPFTKIHVPVLKNLEEKIASGSSIDVEFVNDSIRRPDITTEYMASMEKTFEGRPFVTAGDLMVSYTDRNGQKHLVQFLKRTDLASWLKMEYAVLNMMVNIVAPHLMDEEELKLFAKEKKDFHTKKKGNAQQEGGQLEDREFLEYTLSGFFTSPSIQKLVQAREAMQQRSKQLDNLPERQKMLYEEWQENFDLLSSRIKDIRNNPAGSNLGTELDKKIRQSRAELNIAGKVYTTEDMFTLSGGSPQEKEIKKEIRNRALRWIAGKTKPVWEVVKEKKTEIIVGAILFLTAAYLMTKSFTYNDGHVFYTTTTLPHLLLVGTLLPALFYLVARYYPNAMEGAKKLYDAKIGKKDSRVRTFLQSSTERWKDTGYHQRLTGWGTRIVSFGMLPFWIHITEWMGQPHFFPALQKKLKVFDRISPDSDIGQIVGLKKETTLGVSSLQWNKNSAAFQQHVHLQNVAQEKQFRVEAIAWLMATLAVTQKENVSPTEILIYGFSNFDLDAVIKAHQDQELKLELFWVIQKLKAEMEKKNNLDMRKTLAELDPKVLTAYYEEAKLLAQKFHASPNKKKIRKMIYDITQLIDKTPLGYLRHPRNWATLNMVESNQLRNIPTDFVANRVILEFISDHLVVMLMPLVATGRADVSLDAMTRDMSIYANKLGLTAEAHLQDIWLNVIMHFFIAAGQRSLLFTRSGSDIDKIYNQYARTYESVAQFVNPITGKENTIPDEFRSLGSYLAMRGESDATSNFGALMWKDWKTRTKMWQMGAILHSSMRWALTDQTWSQIFFSYLMINLAGGAINGWWMLINGAAQLNDAKLTENKNRMEELRNTLYKIENKLYTSSEDLQASYEEVLLAMVDLYRKNGFKKELLKAIKTANPQLFSYISHLQKGTPAELSILPSEEEMTRTANRLLTLISMTPPLPTEKNQFARGLIAFLIGAIFSTWAAVELIIYTFNPNYLNWGTVGVLAASTAFIYIALVFGYKKYDLKWSTYFYERALGLGKRAYACRQAFIKTKLLKN